MGNGRMADAGIRLNKNLVVSGAVLVGIGGFLAATGLLLGSTAFASAMRQWVRQLDQPPSEMARQKWNQARAATLAGAKAWQGDSG
ncbi:MAG TPA: hypothetical protein VH112_03375 [Acidimicrobiales bacterium]|jgi:hypothetical protein|nr:hypothetical protein [Acidimicrobiales bacterium]